MKQSSRYFTIGLFVILGFGLFVLGCVLFGGSQLFAKKVVFETYFATSVQGLDEGGPVKFRGMKIGKIEEVGFAGSHYGDREEVDRSAPGIHRALSYVRVVCSIDLKRHPHFTEDRMQAMLKRGLRANLALQGITGSVFVDLDFVRASALASANEELFVPWKPDVISVPPVQSTLQTFLSVAENIAAKLEAIDFSKTVDSLTQLVQNADRTLSQANIPQLSATFLTLGETLNAEVKQLDILLNQLNAERLGHNLQAAVADIASMTASVKEALPSLTASANGTLTQAQQTLQDLDALLKEASAAIGTLRASVDPQTLSADLEQTLSALARTSAALEILVNELKERPSRLIFDDAE